MMPLRAVYANALVLSLLLAGCSGPALQVKSDYDAGYAFRKVKTWDWAPTSGALQTDAAVKTSQRIQLDSLVRGHIERVLRGKGLQPGQPADVLVAWSFGEWELDRHHNPNGGYGAVGLMYPGLHGSNIPVSKDGRAEPPSLDPYSSKYEQARLEIAVMEAGTSRVIWNATVTDDTDFGYFTASQQKRIGAAVDRILQDFPPMAAGPVSGTALPR